MRIFSKLFTKDKPTNAYDAAACGDYENTKFLYENKQLEYCTRNYLGFAAILGGNVKILEYFLSNGVIMKYNREDDIMDQALQEIVKTNNILMVQYLFEEVPHFEIVNRIFEISWESGNAYMVESLIQLTKSFTYQENDDLLYVVKRGYVDLIRLWFQNRVGLERMTNEVFEDLLEKCRVNAILGHHKECENYILHLIRNYEVGIDIRKK